jgi:hypothetical protein
LRPCYYHHSELSDGHGGGSSGGGGGGGGGGGSNGRPVGGTVTSKSATATAKRSSNGSAIAGTMDIRAAFGQQQQQLPRGGTAAAAARVHEPAHVVAVDEEDAYVGALQGRKPKRSLGGDAPQQPQRSNWSNGNGNSGNSGGSSSSYSNSGGSYSGGGGNGRGDGRLCKCGQTASLLTVSCSTIAHYHCCNSSPIRSLTSDNPLACACTHLYWSRSSACCGSKRHSHRCCCVVSAITFACSSWPTTISHLLSSAHFDTRVQRTLDNLTADKLTVYLMHAIDTLGAQRRVKPRA